MRADSRPLLASLAAALLMAALAPAGRGEAVIATIAGAGGPANNGDAGPALTVNINQPFGVEIGPADALYVTEVGHHRVWRVERPTGAARVVAGSGQKGYAGDGGPATKAKLDEPYEVRFNAAGDMFFVEMKNHLVRRVDAKSGIISTIAGTGQPGFAGDGGPAAKAKFSIPHSIALDDRGQLYVADIGNHRIRAIDLKDGTVRTIAGDGGKKLPRDGESALGAPVLGPRALAITGRDLWVALREGHSIWRLNLDDGRWRHIAGTGKRGFTGDGGDPKKATFDGPKGIVATPGGILYVVDTENQAIRRIDVNRGIVTTVAGGGPKSRGFAGDTGPAPRAKLARPHGVGWASDNTLFIGDSENHRVRVLTGLDND